MVEQQAAALDRVFHALANPTRRAMLSNLAKAKEFSLSELAARASARNMSFAAVSKHVRVLEDAGLVRRRIEGRTHYCRIAPEPLKTVDEWLRYFMHYWNEKLDVLEALFAAEGDVQPTPKGRKKK